jgi:hypothetical protein
MIVFLERAFRFCGAVEYFNCREDDFLATKEAKNLRRLKDCPNTDSKRVNNFVACRDESG